MNRNTIDLERFEVLALLRLRDFALLINLDICLLQLGKDITALVLGRQIQHLAKHSAGAIKMRCRDKRNKELTTVDRCTGCTLRSRRRPILDRARGHGQNTSCVVSQ